VTTSSYRPLWGPNLVVPDASNFEGILTWSSGTQASAIALSNGTTDPSKDGTHSLKITKGATTTGALAVNGTTDIPISASLDYVLAFGFYTAKPSVTINVNIDWYTSGQVFISSTVTSTQTMVQGSGSPLDNQFWSQYGAVTVTTPATTAFARLNVQHVSGLVSTDIVFIDTVIFARLLEPVYALPVQQTVNRAATR
jgi:hypothetical protein